MTGAKGIRAALKALHSPKPSPKPEKAEKIKEPKIDGASVGGNLVIQISINLRQTYKKCSQLWMVKW